MFDDSNEPNHGFDSNGEEGQAFFDLRDGSSPSGAQSSPLQNEQQDLVGRPPEQFSRETRSPSSGIITNSEVDFFFLLRSNS